MKKIEDINSIKEYLIKNNICHRTEYVLKYETYFKTGGVAKVFLEPKDEFQLESVAKFLNSIGAEYRVIGFTSNIMFFDEIDYSIIISTKRLSNITVVDNIITVESGYSLQEFVRVCVIEQFEGFEGLEGIPGSIGGALIMNAGAYGDDISDNLLSVKCIVDNNEVVILKKDQCSFCYRDSIFKHSNIIILSAVFSASRGRKEIIRKKIEKFHIARHSYQEFVYPNLGSMISINRDIYGEILKNNYYYYWFYLFLKVVLKNPLVKLIKRKRPSNDVFNIILKKYIDSISGSLIGYEMSSKSANILINDGRLNSEDIVNYVFTIFSLVGEGFRIENEFIVDAVYQVAPDFKVNYKKIIKLIHDKGNGRIIK